MPSITFTAPTLRELERQIREFIGPVPPVAPAAPAAPAGRPVPTWAPAGSRWQDSLGAPVLLDASGTQIPVSWATGEPMPGVVIVNHDADAEAAGAALLAATRRRDV